MITHVRKMVCLVILLSACASQTSTPSLTSATTTQATLSPIPSTTVPTPTSLPDGDLVYGDPRGRFSMPLAGGWTPVATDESFGHFRLADPALELYVIAVESNDLLEASEAALAQIGLDPAALAQPDVLDLQHWTILVYPTDSGQGVSLAARAIEGATVAVILSGDLKVIAAPPQEALLTLDRFGFVPLSEYVEFQTPPAPRTVADIQDLNDIVFYNGRTPLRGKLVVPEGDGLPGHRLRAWFRSGKARHL